MRIGKVYKTKNSGEVRVLAVNNCADVEVMFLDTGYTRSTHASSVRSGALKDRMRPQVFGVGFIGYGPHKSSHKIDGKNYHVRTYTAWHCMLKRCYCPKYQADNPCYQGVTVCDEWMNYQTFADWMVKQDYEGLDLDKDILHKNGLKVYSPKGCKFVTRTMNNQVAKSRMFEFLAPDGRVFVFLNLCSFSRMMGLNRDRMNAVFRGSMLQHKGWKLCPSI